MYKATAAFNDTDTFSKLASEAQKGGVEYFG